MILRKEELESEEEQDELLIGHLDKKLVDLEREQSQLEKTHHSVKVRAASDADLGLTAGSNGILSW